MGLVVPYIASQFESNCYREKDYSSCDDIHQWKGNFVKCEIDIHIIDESFPGTVDKNIISF